MHRMLFGKRDKKKQPNERVLDLKARVDALRLADEATREKEEPYSLDHFLSGDDVLTGREVEDTYTPAGAEPDVPYTADAGDGERRARGPHDGYEVDLEAELRKYLARQEAQAGQDEQTPAPEPHEGPVNRQGHDAGAERVSSPQQPAPSAEAATGTSSSLASLADEWAAFDATAATDASESVWPDSKEWPAEEDWPPRDEKAV